MAVKEAFRKKAAKIEVRHWESLVDLWIRYPNSADSPGESPQEELFELDALREQISQVRPPHPLSVAEDIPGLREAVLKQAFFFLQRAAHAWIVAERSANSKFRCHALSTYYDSGFLACRSIVGLLGVTAIPSVGSKQHFLVDLCGGIVEGTRKMGLPKYYIRILETDGQSIKHQEWWFLLQKTLQKTKKLPSTVPSEIVTELCALGDTDFATQRNHLLYRATYWPHDEVRLSHLRGEFAVFGSISRVIDTLRDAESDVFLVALANSVIRLGIGLLSNLSAVSGQFEQELAILTSWFEADDRWS